MYHRDNIIPKGSLYELVMAHDKAVEMANQAFSTIHQIEIDCNNILGESSYVIDYRLKDGMDRTLKSIKQYFWWYVVKRSDVRRVMDHKARHKLDENLGSERLPDFTVENIQLTLYGWAESSDDAFKQLILNTYKACIPGRRNPYKTNKKYRIGPKIILMGCLGLYNHMSQYREDELNDLERVFLMLDKKTTPDYPDNMTTKIKNARSKGDIGWCNDYFECSWFKNGNLHIKFKRLDLLKEFNRLAGQEMANMIGGDGL